MFGLVLPGCSRSSTKRAGLGHPPQGRCLKPVFLNNLFTYVFVSQAF